MGWVGAPHPCEAGDFARHGDGVQGHQRVEAGIEEEKDQAVDGVEERRKGPGTVAAVGKGNTDGTGKGGHCQRPGQVRHVQGALETHRRSERCQEQGAHGCGIAAVRHAPCNQLDQPRVVLAELHGPHGIHAADSGRVRVRRRGHSTDGTARRGP